MKHRANQRINPIVCANENRSHKAAKDHKPNTVPRTVGPVEYKYIERIRAYPQPEREEIIAQQWRKIKPFGITEQEQVVRQIGAGIWDDQADQTGYVMNQSHLPAGNGYTVKAIQISALLKNRKLCSRQNIAAYQQNSQRSLKRTMITYPCLRGSMPFMLLGRSRRRCKHQRNQQDTKQQLPLAAQVVTKIGFSGSCHFPTPFF